VFNAIALKNYIESRKSAQLNCGRSSLHNSSARSFLCLIQSGTRSGTAYLLMRRFRNSASSSEAVSGEEWAD